MIASQVAGADGLNTYKPVENGRVWSYAYHLLLC